MSEGFAIFIAIVMIVGCGIVLGLVISSPSYENPPAIIIIDNTDPSKINKDLIRDAINMHMKLLIVNNQYIYYREGVDPATIKVTFSCK